MRSRQAFGTPDPSVPNRVSLNTAIGNSAAVPDQQSAHRTPVALRNRAATRVALGPAKSPVAHSA
jgi:hypothetical protein